MKPGIDLYCLCWNDAFMLPHFFRHYDPLVRRYFILDNGSTDDSLALLHAHPKVSVSHFDVTGDSFVDEERRLSDSIWRRSQGAADWVIVVDIDELLFHPNLAGYLEQCTAAGVTAVRAIGFEMIADHFPTEQNPLVEMVTLGVRSAGHDKLCIFDPAAITHSNFEPGRHRAQPEGRVVWPPSQQVLMLHYKQLGVEHVIRRSAQLRTGLKAGDVKNGWGKQYLWRVSEIAENWAKLRADSGPVPGLGSLSHMDPADYDEERSLADSALFDAEWYHRAYPDVGAENADALSHFCIHGWKEGRKPNFYFDTASYAASIPAPDDLGRNPLLHYYAWGEDAGAKPSEWFDPAWYRQHYRISDRNALAHYLAHRSTGNFSPNPDFDVAKYCAARASSAPLIDPFEESVTMAESAPAQTVRLPDPPAIALPAFSAVIAALGIEPEPAGLRDALRPFLQHVAVDERRYLAAYPDVQRAVSEGAYASGQAHFVQFGYFEGRSPRPEVVE